MSHNIDHIKQEMAFLEGIIKERIKASMKNAGAMNNPRADFSHIPPPTFSDEPSVFSEIHEQNVHSFEERILFALALAVHVKPTCIDRFFQSQHKISPDFGCISGKNFRGMVPTGLTWMYILVGTSVEERLQQFEALKSNQILSNKLVVIHEGFSPEPFLNGPLIIDPKVLTCILTNTAYHKAEELQAV